MAKRSYLLLQGRHTDPLGARRCGSDQLRGAGVIARATAPSQHEGKFVLGVGEPRPSLQLLVHRQCRCEMLFGLPPIAEGCGEHA